MLKGECQAQQEKLESLWPDTEGGKEDTQREAGAVGTQSEEVPKEGNPQCAPRHLHTRD